VDILKPVWFLAFPRPNGLMAGREKTKSLVAVIPGLENAEDFTRAKLFLDFSKNHFEM
jgi:hypothetical protein